MLLGLQSLPAAAGNDYVYDELGRVVQVTDSTGASVQYLYDAAGNITSVKRVAAGELSVSEFTPNSGPVGTTVTLSGGGFNATANLNTVKFNGITAVVTAATVSRLTVTVPSGATTGTISVVVGANTATSAQSFIVTAGVVGPAISAFTPTIGVAGTLVTINGSNFESVASKNQVRFNGVFTNASSATTSQITTAFPLNTSSGRIRVGTPTGIAISATDFFVPPSGYTAADVVTTGRTSIDGAPSTINVATAGKIAIFLFDGVQGQNLGLGVSAVTFTPSTGSGTIYIKTPTGQDLSPSLSFNSSGIRADLPTLPKTGTYAIVVIPSASTVSLSVTLSQDVTASLPVDGAALSLALRSGQKARYTFTGTAGQSLGLGISGLTFGAPSTYLFVTIYKPDGTTWVPEAPLRCWEFWYAPGNRCGIPNLPVSGVYTIAITPTGSGTASMTVTLSADFTGSLTPNINALTYSSTRVGQFGRYTFTVTAGQNYSMLWSASTVPAGTIYILKPDLTQLNWANINNSAGAAGTLNLGALATGGVYTVFVSPNTINTGNVTVRVTSP